MRRIVTLIILVLGCFALNAQTNYIPPAGGNVTYTVSHGDKFYDPGGPGGCPGNDGCANNFPNCGCITYVTLMPSVPGAYVEVEFLVLAMFNTNSSFDWMVIYDNSGPSGTRLFDNGPGGPNVPYATQGADPMFTVTATNPTGALTFQFRASGVVNRAGWDADIRLQNILPINGVSFFSGWNEGEVNVLKWESEVVDPLTEFVIERSEDGIGFDQIASVAATGGIENNGLYEFQFEDDTPLGGMSYYRIHEIDENGFSAFSAVVRVFYSEKGEHPLEIVSMGNSASGGQTNVLYNAEEGGVFRYQLFNTAGQEVANGGIKGQAGFHGFSLNTEALGTGIYILNLINHKGEASTIKWVKS